MRDRLPPQVPGVSLKELKYVKLSKIDELDALRFRFPLRRIFFRC